MYRTTLARFAIVSLLPMIGLGWFLSVQVTASIKTRAADVYGQMTNSIFAMAREVVVQPGDLEGDAYEPGRAEVLDTLIERLGGTHSTARVRIVRPDGRVVYANQPRDNDTTVATSSQLSRSLNGETATRFVRGSINESSGQETLIELFLPIRFDGESHVSGVIIASGLNKDLPAQIDADVRRIRVSLGIGLGVLWLCLLPIASSVSRHLRRTADENEYLALHDTLTGLANRNLFADRLEHAIASTARTGTDIGVLLIDLDGFKEVNDTLGHGKGDQFLQAVADRLARSMRASDTVARLGGDEFAIVAQDVDGPMGLAALVERLLEDLTGAVSLDGIEVAIAASIGGSIFPLHALEPEELVRHADIAMYEAKARRDPFVIYSSDIDSHSPSRLALAADLRRAIDGNDELRLHYQPVASPHTGEVRSVEALVRWEHPTRGLIPPIEFVPMAEQSGLICRLTSKVLDLAARQAREWQDDGLDVRVSVNLSAADLRSMKLLAEVRSTLDLYGLAPDRLELEVTETAILADPDNAVALVTALRELGVSIALDDFGTGYSSLTYLKRLKPDRLKIDRSFVDAMTREPTDAEIVRSVIDLAHSLAIGVTAEGVETREHWELLGRLACDLVQGYYLARPLDASHATAWLVEREFGRVR